jgi:hypothetical protein
MGGLGGRDDLELEGVDPFLGLALLQEQAPQGRFRFAEAGEDRHEFDQVLTGVIEARVGPH